MFIPLSSVESKKRDSEGKQERGGVQKRIVTSG